MKNKRGYFGVGCINMKNNLNYGTLFRTANILCADFIFLIGKRFKKQSSDTMKTHRHLPLFEFKDFYDFKNNIPYGCQIVAVEMSKDAKEISNFIHPETACYLLGAEDSGIPSQFITECHHLVCLRGERSMNVSVAGSIVLYDRVTKMNK